jgi:D-3-phosphoglycerate dehydrogenase
MSEGGKVLVKESIADAAVELLRERFDVEIGSEWKDGELEKRIGEFDGILIRSGTKLTGDLIERAERLKVIGRAGTGVDNVDVEAATRRGIVVANAPEANAIAAAEHTLGLMLALCRNIPEAHATLTGGAWERSRFAGTELYGKTLARRQPRARTRDERDRLRQVRRPRALPRARGRGRREHRGDLPAG